MATTFQKRQKEMKRLEKAKMKAERRAQKKLAEPGETESEFGSINDFWKDNPPLPADPKPQD